MLTSTGDRAKNRRIRYQIIDFRTSSIAEGSLYGQDQSLDEINIRDRSAKRPKMMRGEFLLAGVSRDHCGHGLDLSPMEKCLDGKRNEPNGLPNTDNAPIPDGQTAAVGKPFQRRCYLRMIGFEGLGLIGFEGLAMIGFEG